MKITLTWMRERNSDAFILTFWNGILLKICSQENFILETKSINKTREFSLPTKEIQKPITLRRTLKIIYTKRSKSYNHTWLKWKLFMKQSCLLHKERI